ncbi:MAG: hypothetical protein R3F54_23450 [Alphaproteobacteria bacterium]
MTAVAIRNGRPACGGGYMADAFHGGHNGRVLTEWFSRPEDKKVLSLSDLYASVKGSGWFSTACSMVSRAS